MKIWIIDHYSVPVKYYPLARNTNFAKELIKAGHEVIIFAASTVHNSSINLITDESKYKEVLEDGVKYVLIKSKTYSGNGVGRIVNMIDFSLKLKSVCQNYDRPDVIISTSMTLFACKAGIELARQYGCKAIAQITDLWPESIVAYNLATNKHPLVIFFRHIEKWIYRNADIIVFSMEGAYDYIIERRWEKIVPRDKVYYVNNGIDYELFNYNRANFITEDEDLKNNAEFKVIYTGSIRKVNNLGVLLDAAKLLKDKKIVFLVWGDGDEKNQLEARIESEEISNVKMKGKVDKKYIPYIVSQADLNIAHSSSSPIFRFGISLNKVFDYCAAGKPVLCDFVSKYNPVVSYNAGIDIKSQTPQEIADAIMYFVDLDKQKYLEYSSNALKLAKDYSFEELTNKLIKIINK